MTLDIIKIVECLAIFLLLLKAVDKVYLSDIYCLTADGPSMQFRSLGYPTKCHLSKCNLANKEKAEFDQNSYLPECPSLSKDRCQRNSCEIPSGSLDSRHNAACMPHACISRAGDSQCDRCASLCMVHTLC